MIPPNAANIARIISTSLLFGQSRTGPGVFGATHAGHRTDQRAAGSRGSRSLSLDSEQWVPSPKDFFQLVVRHFRPCL
jgi:hypothetical protein